MKKILKYLALASLTLPILASCSQKKSQEKEINQEKENVLVSYTEDDGLYQVSEEEFKSMNDFGNEYYCDYNFSSGSITIDSMQLIRDNNKITLSIDSKTLENTNYYSLVDGNTYHSLKFENGSYEDIGNFNIASIMPLATSYIDINDIYDNIIFDSKTNEYVLKNYKEKEEDTFTYEMHFLFENKKLFSYSMMIHIDNSITTSSKVTINFNYDNQDIQFPDEVISMLND